MTRVSLIKRRLCLVAIASTGCVLAPQLAHANIITGTRNFDRFQRLTGPDVTGNVGVGGTDLGHSVNHNGKTYFLFGDTFSNEASEGLDGQNWRNNVMSYTTDRNAADGITFDGWITDAFGKAKQVIRPGTAPTTYIPTGAISVNNKIYAWYMHVSNWGGWTLDHSGLSSWSEGQSSFTTVPNFRFQAPTGNIYTTDEGRGDRGNFGMVAASQRSPLEGTTDDNVYLWGTPGGRYGGVKLARVAPASIENRSAYQFFDGTVDGVPQWTSDEYAGDRLIQNNVGEMSVMYNEALEAWTLLYQNGATSDFEIRHSKTPWGQWSEPVTVLRSSEMPGLYAPFMNPLYVEGKGKTLYFTMSLWNPYDVYLAKVDLDIDMQTRWTGATSNWSDLTKWTYGAPVAGDRTFIDNGGTAQLNATVSARNVDLGSAAGLSGNLNIGTGGALTIHEGGFRLGVADGGTGNLTMTAGSVNIIGGYNLFLVGDNGDGTAAISGGSITARSFGIALQATSTGHVDLSGNAVINTTGDRFVMAMTRNVATGARPVASMNMTGGTIKVNAGALPDAVIGFDGVADLDMSGGTFNVAGLFVSAVAGASGSSPRSQATIDQSGGTINAARMAISENGVSQYNLSGTGDINLRGRLTVAWRAGSEATLHQTGGTVDADLNSTAPNSISLMVAESGRGTYRIDAGALNVARSMRVGDLAGSVGRFEINGGTVNVGNTLWLGNLGSAVLTQSGGSLTVGTQLRVGAGDTLNYLGGTITTPSLQVDAGGKVRLGSGGGKSLSLDTLTIDAAGGGVLDVADNRLVLRNGGAAGLALINNLIESGYHGGDWAGTGITSSTAATDSSAALGSALASSLGSVPSFFGSVDPLAVLVRYTFRGDSDLSGSVDFADLVALAQNYSATAANKLWHEGDSNYDGQVDFTDLVSLAQNYGKGSTIGAERMELLSDDFVADWALAQSLVPEPTSALALGLLGGTLLRRRRA